MLSVAAVAASPLVCFFQLVIFLEIVGSSPRQAWPWVVAHVLTALLLVAAWVLIWLGQIRWTPARVWSVPIIVGLACVPALIAAFTLGKLIGYSDAHVLQTLMAGMIWAPCFVAGTAIAWRETAIDRAARLREMGAALLTCARCGYNLTGITSGQCPECGEGFAVSSAHEIPSAPAAGAGDWPPPDYVI